METIVYAARVKDKELLKRSSSGGAFTALSDVFLENGDAVVCAVYNYTSHDCEYRLVLTKKERDEARKRADVAEKAEQEEKTEAEILKKEYDALMKKSEDVLTELEEEGIQKYKPVHRSKAKIHTYLAWQDIPGRPMGQAITANILNANSELAMKFAKWLKELF